MSIRYLQKWLRKSHQSLNDSFVGEAHISNALCDGLRPDPDYTVSEWAAERRLLSEKSSAEPGRWRNERTPYSVEIMDALSVKHPAQKVVIMKGTQLGFTEVGNNWLAYVIDIAPGPTMAVQPNLKMQERNVKLRINPLIQENERLKNKVGAGKGAKDSGDTNDLKEFPGGALVLTGANSATGLRSMPARNLFLDELDAFPHDVDNEGSPADLAVKRTDSFGPRKKVFMVSTPKLKGLSQIENYFLRSDQRYYFVPCPHCNEKQVIKFSNFKWEEDLSSIWLECEHCDGKIYEHYKTQMLAKGEWIPTAKAKEPYLYGYHLSALYSPLGWFSWRQAVQDYLDSQDDEAKAKQFFNTVLGETYEVSTDAPESRSLYDRRESYRMGEAPQEVMFITAGVDVQKDRLEYEIVGWGKDSESWSIEYDVIEGDPYQDEVWKELEEKVFKRVIKRADGALMPIWLTAVDSSAYTKAVYAQLVNYTSPSYSSGYGHRCMNKQSVMIIKGDNNPNVVTSLKPPRKINIDGLSKKINLYLIGVSHLKSQLYSFLKLTPPTHEELAEGVCYPKGFCHFPEYPESYFEMLTAEKMVVKPNRDGHPQARWELPPNTRNEALDCRVYARAAADVVGLKRFSERKWDNLEKENKENIPKEGEEEKKPKKTSVADALKKRQMQQRHKRIISED